MADTERKRASLFSDPVERGTELNLDRFAPRKAETVDPVQVEKVSKDAGFTTKHAPEKKKRDGRSLKRSKRTNQFNVRLRPEIAERFWSGAENEGMTYADDFLTHLLELYEGSICVDGQGL